MSRPSNRRPNENDPRRGRKLRVERLEDRTMLAGDLELVKDINSLGNVASVPANFVEVGGLVYFTADDGVHGIELWKSDGTAVGTVLVKDIRPGLEGSSPGGLANIGGVLFFSANDGVTGIELWRSDGTVAGTSPVKDIALGSSSPASLVNVGGVVYFTAFDELSGTELWKSDGSESGTIRLRDINAGSGSSAPRYLTNVGGTLYFTCNDGVNGEELWKSDGSATGTSLVHDIRPGTFSAAISALTEMNGALFFAADDGVHGKELWKSDGTSEGTLLIKDIRIGGGYGFVGYESENVNGVLYFQGVESSTYDLWRSDGTVAGTYRVSAVPDGSMASALTNVGGTLFFEGFRDLWRTDGTPTGTFRLADLNPNSFSFIVTAVNANGQLFFLNRKPNREHELWVSDGTITGTIRLKEWSPYSVSSVPFWLVSSGSKVYFSANDVVTGGELWTSNGSVLGTRLVKDIRIGSQPSAPKSFVNVNGNLFFQANDGVSGRELWRSNGTESGTFRVKDISAGAGSSSPTDLTNVSETLFFAAQDSLGNELWKSDGSELGTVRVKDIFASGSSSPTNLTNVSGTLFFVAGSISGRDLWKSDGTAAGTVLVKDLTNSSYPRFLTNVGGVLYFVVNDGVNGEELWKSDGTAAGTVIVKDIIPGSSGSKPNSLISVNGVLYFIAEANFGYRILWKSDGTTAGTIPVKSNTTSAPYDIEYLTNVGGVIYFRDRGSWLSKSDGTDRGTVRIKNLRSNYSNGYLNTLTNASGVLYFTVNDGVSGQELWKSDGTDSGTVRVKDIRTGSLGSGPRSLTHVGGTLYFSANDGVNGYELWKSDGTDAGTIPIRFADGAVFHDPNSITEAGLRLFAAGYKTSSDTEIFAIDYALAGDYNRDGVVQQLDESLWRESFSTSTQSGVGADGNRDEQINAADYTIWRDHFGEFLDDHGATTGTATPANAPGSHEGVINTVTDTDWFRISATEGVEYRVQLALGGLTSGALRIYGPDGATLLASASGSSSPTVLWNPTQTGDYYVEVRGVSYALGNYTVVFTRDDHAAAISTAALSSSLGDVFSGNIWSATDADWFRLGANPGFDYRAQLTLNGLTNSALRVYGHDGVTLIASDVDGGAATVSWTATTPGPYFVEVRGLEGATGDYSLVIDRDDRGGTAASSELVSVPSTTAAYISSSTDLDWFRVNTVVGYEYRAQLALNGLPSGSLRVYGPDGVTLLASDTDGDAASVVWAASTAGDYYVEVSGVAGAVGAYAVSLSREDHGAGPDIATFVSVPSATAGEIWSPTDIDWFSVSASAGFGYRATLNLNTLTSGVLRVYGSDGLTLLASDIDGGVATVFWTPTTTSAYFVEVSGFAGAMGTYTVSVARDDHANAASAATLVSIPNATTGEIWIPTDTDWFRFTAVANAEYRAQLTPNGLTSGALRIYGPDGVTLITSDTSSAAPAVVWTAATAGTYYVEVRGIGGATGAYRLTVDRDNQNDTFSAATLVSTNSSTPGIIGTATDKDWFRITPTLNAEYRAQLTLFGLVSGGMKVYAPDGQIVVASDVDGGAAELVWAATLSGSYYVEVTGIGGATGAYSLTIGAEDHGSNASRATIVSSTSTTAGLIGSATDSDWFRFTATLNVEYRALLNLNGLTSGGLRVYAPDGLTLVASDTDGGSAALIWTTTFSGSYYIEVVGVSGSTGAYSLGLAREDHGSVATRATSVAIPSTTAGLIGTPTDLDWFRFTATAGVNYRLTLALNLLTSGTLRIYDSTGSTVLASDLDGGAATLDFTPTTTGTYYAEVAGFAGAMGTYSLGIALAPPSSAAIAFATAAVSAGAPAPTTISPTIATAPMRWRRPEFVAAANSAPQQTPELCLPERSALASSAAARDEAFALWGAADSRNAARRLRRLR